MKLIECRPNVEDIEASTYVVELTEYDLSLIRNGLRSRINDFHRDYFAFAGFKETAIAELEAWSDLGRAEWRAAWEAARHA